MVSSTTRKIISIAISLLLVVISLTGIALGAAAPDAPAVTQLPRYIPTPGFAGTPGKMARDAAGNFYVTDFWAKGIVKLNRQGGRIGFIATLGRPSAVAVLPDNRLVVAMTVPRAYVAFYSQAGGETAEFGAPVKPYYRPSGVTVDDAGFIYVVDTGDISSSTTVNVGTVRVYSPAGVHLHAFGTRTYLGNISTTMGQFHQPMGIVYEKSKQQIAVADSLNSRVQFFGKWNGTSCPSDVSVGSAIPVGGAATVGALAKFGSPSEVAFEYDGSGNLSRMYVTERSRNEISVVDLKNGSATYGFDVLRINASAAPFAEIKYPSGIVFERTATTPTLKGVLYVSNASAGNQANVLPLAIEGGAVPVPSIALAITSSVPPTVTSAALTVTGSVAPANAVKCSVNAGADVDATGSWSADLTLQTGANYILCKSTDVNGVTSYAEANTYLIGVKDPAPTISISTPSTGVFTSKSTVTVTGTSNTAYATVKLVNSLGGSTVYTQTDASKKWGADVAVANGTNLITVEAYKPGTNVGSATVTVNGDNAKPVVVLSFLSNGKTTNIPVQNLSGIITEANLKSIEVNGTAVPVTAMVTSGSTINFSLPVTLVRGNTSGANSFTVKVTDLADNSETATTGTVTLNPELPGLTVAIPADNSYMAVAGASTAANGSVDPVFSTVTIPGSVLTPAAGSWSGTFTTTADFNTYEFKASGGSTEMVVKRTINATAGSAQLAITSPAADLATNNPEVTISGAVAAGSIAPTISVDGGTPVTVSTYTSGTGDFSHPLVLGLGTHVIKVIASNGTTAVRNVIYDTILPEITLKADSKVAPTTITGSMGLSDKIAQITAKLGTGAEFTIPINRVTFNPYVQNSDAIVWRVNLTGYSYDYIKITTESPSGQTHFLTRVAGIPTGDIDGDGVVRLSDALAALRHVAGTELLAGNPKFQADVGALIEGQAGQDGVVDITDAVLVLNKSYGLLSF